MACCESATSRLVPVILVVLVLVILQQTENWLPRRTFKPPPEYQVLSYQDGTQPNSSNSNRLPSTKAPLQTYGDHRRIAYTSNVYTSADIINAKASYKVNDTIQIRIIARDINNIPKTYGGDYFRVKLYTAKQQASWSIDVTNDQGNGTYLADVTLRWPGKVAVIVTLIHPSEAIRVLERNRDVEPGRSVFKGRYVKKFDSGVEIFEDAMCLPKVIQNQLLCNFTDGRNGYPWFCIAPSHKNLSCSDWQFYATDGELSKKYTLEGVSEEEQKIFKVHKLPIKRTPPPLIVKGDLNSWKQSLLAYQKSLPHCKAGQHLHNPVPSGFYSNNVWFSDQCRIRRFTKRDVLQCLENRRVYLFGDSTVRQFYLELADKYKPDIAGKARRDKSDLAGPMFAKGTKLNISVVFKFHGFPARPSGFVSKDSRSYIVNELDDLRVDSRSVILISVGTHYTTYPLSLYEKRMKDIRSAVQRLHKRSPQTLVVFKSSNTRNCDKLFYQFQNSEWYIRTLDLTLRAVLKDVPEVAFVDAWDMTIAQNFKDHVHPHAKVLSNLMNNFLSYICPHEPKT